MGAAENFAPHVSVSALDANGKVLGTTTAQTWVPSPDVRESANCDEVGCAGANVSIPNANTKEAAVAKASANQMATMGHFAYNPTQSCAEECTAATGMGQGAMVVALLVLVVGLECAYLFGRWIVRRGVEARRRKGASEKWMWKGDGEGEGKAYRDEEGVGMGGGRVVDGEGQREGGGKGVSWGSNVRDETPRAPKGTRRPSVKRSKSGWEEPGKVSSVVAASGHEV